MIEQRLQQQIFEGADLQNQAAEALARSLADSVHSLLGCVTAGGKLLIAGVGAGLLLAQHLALLLVRGFERERPPLAALALPDGAPAPQIQALGLPGDVLVLFDDGSDAGALRAAIAAAHDKDMTVLAFSGAEPAWRETLTEADVLVAVPSERRARVLELHLTLVHALADGLDLQLMGEQESE